MTFNQAKKYIDLIISEFPKSYKYIIDLTGSGEPLLNIDLVKDIAKYCNNKMNEIGKRISVLLTTNGTLLTPTNINAFYDSKVLFSISLDGDKRANDNYRKYKSGKGTYKDIIKNIKKIKDRTLLGVSSTVTNTNYNLVKNVILFEKNLLILIFCM